MLLSKSNTKPKLKVAEPDSYSFEAIGTQWTIYIEQQITKLEFGDLMTDVHARIEKFDKNYSRFRDDSLVSQMSKTLGSYNLPKDAEPMFDLYKRLYDVTDGRMTPLIGQMLSDAGYDSSYSLKPKALAEIPEWDEAIDYSYPDLVIKCPFILDVGAIGKGYLVDIVAELMKAKGLTSFSIDAGGDILNSGVSKSLSDVGLENPVNLGQVIGIASVVNSSICGSAGNRRTWGDFNHLIDPKTKMSPKDILATWVIADSARLADGLSTALFFANPEILAANFNFEYALVNNDMSIEQSTNFPAKFFTSEDTVE
jgi:thiamine biosynthesis lipoprotein